MKNKEVNHLSKITDATVLKLIEDLKRVGWSDAEIVALLSYIANK